MEDGRLLGDTMSEAVVARETHAGSLKEQVATKGGRVLEGELLWHAESVKEGQSLLLEVAEALILRVIGTVNVAASDWGWEDALTVGER